MNRRNPQALTLILRKRVKAFQKHPIATLDRNKELERDLVCLKEESNKSLKWTTCSPILFKLTSQNINDCRGLVYQVKL